MLDKLKQRWELKSNLDVFLVIVMFSCAGMSSVWIKKPLFAYLGFNSGETILDLVKYILLYIMFFMPIYQAMLLFWGFVLRQWEFALKFEKKILKRFTYMAITAAVLYILIWLFTR